MNYVIYKEKKTNDSTVKNYQRRMEFTFEFI